MYVTAQHEFPSEHQTGTMKHNKKKIKIKGNLIEDPCK